MDVAEVAPSLQLQVDVLKRRVGRDPGQFTGAPTILARPRSRRSAACQQMTSVVDRVAARSTTYRKERTPCNTC